MRSKQYGDLATGTRSHELADRAEKRRIVESTTSNRYVIGKEVYLEPRKWLVEVKNLSSTPGGDPSRIIDRIRAEKKPLPKQGRKSCRSYVRSHRPNDLNRSRSVSVLTRRTFKRISPAFS